MKQSNLFDIRRGEKLKTAGMAQAADNCAEYLGLARDIARSIAAEKGAVTADDVGRELKNYHGIDTLGPAAGSIFRGSEWEFTGNFVKSSRITNHGRMIREWRLK